jgi:hypothetical protein
MVVIERRLASDYGQRTHGLRYAVWSWAVVKEENGAAYELGHKELG